MKRQLNDEERKVAETSVKRITEEVSDLNKNLDYNKALIEKQAFLRDFDDNWRDLLREQKDKEDEELFKKMSEYIETKVETLNELDKQLKEGVEKSTSIG